MPKVRKDETQEGVYHFEETPQEKEIREMKETLAELQDLQEKQRQELVDSLRLRADIDYIAIMSGVEI